MYIQIICLRYIEKKMCISIQCVRRILRSWPNSFGFGTPRCALYTRRCCPPYPLGRQVGLCTAVCAALPGLLDATWTCTVGTGCTFRADLGSKVAFGAPTCSLHIQNELQLALQLPFQSAPDLQKFGRDLKFVVQAFLQLKCSWIAI